MSKLVIVESPAKAKTISKFLGKDYTVKACMGHVRDLPEQELGIDITDNFRPKYVTIKGKTKILNELKKASEMSQEILLATDPDREGEAIAWHIIQSIGRKNRGANQSNRATTAKNEIQRILFNEITEKAIKRAAEHPLPIDMNKVNAQQARRILDRLVGYKVSPFLWKTIYSGLSAGRVQSVALRLICQRESEIVAFIPREYWSIEAELQEKSCLPFRAKLIKWRGENISIADKDQAGHIIEQLRELPFRVGAIDRGEIQKNPLPPFITSTLQQDAVRRLNFPTKKTMSVAQQLYEGIDIGGETIGLITYMRTDSVRSTPEAISDARQFITTAYGKSYLPKTPRTYRNRETAQDAHEAIRPTSVSHHPDRIRAFLTDDQRKLYDLIWRRFIASQMTPAVLKTTSADIEAGDYLFRASESILHFPGFMALYIEASDDDATPEEKKIPETLTPGESLSLLDIIPEQHFTKPPPRYTEATLVKELDAKGIGRPSTYAQIISTILDRDYVKKEKGRFWATELGLTVNDLLTSSFPDIFNVEFTAKMENDLDRIETGEDRWDDVVKNFYEPFQHDLRVVTEKSRTLKQALQEMTDQTCDLCGRPMVVKWGRNGKFMACSGYPACRNTLPIEQRPHVSSQEETCDKCGSPMQVKNGRYGPFLACSNYPTCQNTRPISVGVPCPADGCGGTIVEKRTRRGRTFYGCSRYPSCRYATWDRPVAQPCPSCGAPFLLTKKDHLTCPKCHYESRD